MALSRGPDPSPSFRFSVEIKGVKVAQFSECSGLEFETEVFEYKEGGLNKHIHRFPGRWKFTNLTLKKGIATDGKFMWKWVEEILKNANNQISPTHDVTVILHDPKGQPLRTWVFKDAYPVKWSATALSADQNAIAIETLALAHQGLDISQ